MNYCDSPYRYKRRETRPVTIGDPIANTQMYVLDDRDALCAPGVVGSKSGAPSGAVERGRILRAAARWREGKPRRATLRVCLIKVAAAISVSRL